MKYSQFKEDRFDFMRAHISVNTLSEEFVTFDNPYNLSLLKDPFRIENIAFILCLGGYVEFSINLKKVILKKNSLLLISPNQIVQFNAKSDDLRIRCFVVSQRFAEESVKNIQNKVALMLQIIKKPCIVLHDDELNSIIDLYTFALQKIKPNNTKYRRGIAQGLLQILCCEVSSIYENHQISKYTKKTRKEEILELFLYEVEQNYKISRSISFYADKLRLSSKHLSKIVKEISGKSASEWIDNYVILEAKVLLKTSYKTIQQITYELNFPNQSFFGKYFKQHTGISPSKYKISRELDSISI